MQLSEHFTLAEFTRSETATRKGIPNIPSRYDINRMELLCNKVLEPIHIHIEMPMRITSGFRCKRLNRKVGGSRSSQHCYGMSADFHIDAFSDMNNLFCLIIDLKLPFDQLIHEYLDPEAGEGWIHISHRAGNNRHQIKRAYKVSKWYRRKKYTKTKYERLTPEEALKRFR